MNAKAEHIVELNLNDFQRISSFIYNYCGIYLKPEKRILVQSRLQSRLRALHLDNFTEYVRIVLDSRPDHPEIIHMVDRVSTNKTDFFREAEHFTFLKQTILPEYLDEEGSIPLSVWSAGCSSGEEPYTIAMVMQDFAERNKGLRYSILATDISSEMIKVAGKAVYDEHKAEAIPLDLKKKYLLRSVDRAHQLVRIVPEIRTNILFEVANLLEDNPARFGTFDVVFCRNVLIYFDRVTQQKVINNICNRIRTGGYLLTGYSEALTNFEMPLVQVKSAVYRKI